MIVGMKTYLRFGPNANCLLMARHIREVCIDVEIEESGRLANGKTAFEDAGLMVFQFSPDRFGFEFERR